MGDEGGEGPPPVEEGEAPATEEAAGEQAAEEFAAPPEAAEAAEEIETGAPPAADEGEVAAAGLADGEEGGGGEGQAEGIGAEGGERFGEEEGGAADEGGEALPDGEYEPGSPMMDEGQEQEEEDGQMPGVGAGMEDVEEQDPYAGFEEEDEEQYDQGSDDLEEEHAVEDQGDPLQELKDKLEELIEQNERLQQDNVSLQRRVIQWKAQRDKYDATDKPPSEGKVTEHKYLNVLNHVHGVRLRLRMQQVKSARMSDELKNQLEEKRAKAIECRDSFRDFKRQVARHAEYSRTGKRIPLKIIQEVEDFELDKDAEVEEVRGSNISLKNRMAKLEQALRKKDELADNLHVIDFEQLKIENQTLNEKIEERNEELHKLRKKTVITVQVITHMREKLQFIQQENQVLKTELAQLDQELASQRDLVAKTKHERDDYRSENAKLRQQTGIINSDLLTKDYDDRQNLLKRLKEELQTLKGKHKRMMIFIKEHSAEPPPES